MVLGKIVHLTIDAVLLSTVFAGIRRTSGFSPDASGISDPILRSIAERYLNIGETVFDIAQASAVNSSYFKRKTGLGS